MKKSDLTILKYFTLIITGAMINVSAFADNYLIMSNTEHKYHQEIVSIIGDKLQLSGDKFDSIDTVDFNDTDVSTYSSLITIGYKAASSVINANLNKPVLSLLIPKLALNLLIKENIEKENRYLYSAIYIDQPIDRQARLIRNLSDSFKTVGVLYGKNSYSRKDSVSKTLKKHKLNSSDITVLDRTELISETRYLSENSDILLAIPDNTIYNRRSIKGILLTTYRNQIPVIGYSHAYVKAGALAAVFSTPENISKHAIEILLKNKTFNYISATRSHPKYFDVSINKKVARSLSIHTIRKNDLLKKLQKSEPRHELSPGTKNNRQEK